MSTWLIVSLLIVVGIGVVACGTIVVFLLHILFETLSSINDRVADLKFVSLLTAMAVIIFIIEFVLMARLFCLLFE